MEALPPGILEVQNLPPHRSELPVSRGKQADAGRMLFTAAVLRKILEQ